MLYKIHVAFKKQIRNKTVFFDNSVFFFFAFDFILCTW